MYPFLYEVPRNGGSIPIPMYGLMVLLAFTAAFAVIHGRARRVGIEPERMVLLYAAAALCGLAGARLLYAFAVEPLQTLKNPLSLVTSAGGLAFYGGLLGGAAGVIAVSAWQRLPGWKVVDILAPAAVLGLGIGRFGCFFAGCCHGAVAPIGPHPHALLPEGLLKGQIWLDSTFPWLTLEFHRGGMGRLLDVPLYPTQLWSAAAGLTIAGVLMWMWNHRRFDGQILAMMFIVEPIARILIESFRADERGYVLSWEVAHVPAWLPPGFTSAGEVLPGGLHPSAMLVGVTTSQFIGLAMIAFGLAVFALRWNAGVGREQALAEEV